MRTKMKYKNNQVSKLIESLKIAAIEKKVPLWKRIAVELEKPTRRKREVNVFKIEKFARNEEIIVVPGKVLGSGAISKKVTVAALSFSDSAKDKIKSVKGEALSIADLLEKNPQGSKVRIMG